MRTKTFKRYEQLRDTDIFQDQFNEFLFDRDVQIELLKKRDPINTNEMHLFKDVDLPRM